MVRIYGMEHSDFSCTTVYYNRVVDKNFYNKINTIRGYEPATNPYIYWILKRRLVNTADIWLSILRTFSYICGHLINYKRTFSYISMTFG